MRHIRRRQGERGAALVEFAILMPLLVLLIFGIWTLARGYNVQNSLEHAARQAARLGAVDASSLPAVAAVAQGDLQATAIPWTDVTWCVGTEDDSGPGTRLTGGPDAASLGSPCVSLANGAGGDDPTGGERVHVLLKVVDYELNFLLWSVEVDLVGTAVARQEPS